MIRLSWIISCGLALFSVMCIQYFFQMGSETGNLGIVGIAIAFPFVGLCIFITYHYFMKISHSRTDLFSRIMYPIFGLLLIGAFSYYAVDYKEAVLEDLGGTIHDPGSSIYQMSWLNAETSVIYFNFYTVLIVIAIAAIAGFIRGMFIKGQPKEEGGVQ